MAETSLITRRSPVTPSSVDAANRTVRVIWSTGAAVLREDFLGPFQEVLSLDPSHVRLDSLIGASVLDSHQQNGLRNVLGVVTDAGIAHATGWAVVKFSSRPDVEPFWNDVKDGIARNISVGYTVAKWSETTAAGKRVKTAFDWTPREISFVAMPADAGATTRASPMTTEPAEVVTTPAPALETRAAVNTEIRALVRSFNLDTTVADGLIDRAASADEARLAVMAELEKRQATAPRIRTDTVVVGTSHDDPATRAAWMGEALYTRLDPTFSPSDPARQYVGLTLPEMGREILRLRGISTTGMAAGSVITRTLHSTSDFAIILGDTVGRTLRKAYEAAPSGIRQLARQVTVKDFRAKTAIQLGEAPTLEKVNEHGEFASGTMAEAKESYKADTFGRVIGLTRQAMVNDDLGAFSDLSRRFGQAAAEIDAQLLVDLIEQNAGTGPTMDDTHPLFHAAHANLASTTGAPSETTLSAGRLAMRKQTGLSGSLVRVTPKFILLPAELETTTEKVLAAISPAKTADVNVFSGALTPVVEPRLSSATRWYITASPAEIDGLEYCYLEGAPGPQIESRNGFEVDGVQIRVRLDYGAGFTDWRGWHCNHG